MSPKCCRLFVFGIVAWGLAAPARGQGLIVDHRPHLPIARTFEVKDVSVETHIRDQVAQVQVSQTFHNPGSFPLEAEYLFPMPDDSAVQNFVFLVDGKELPGKLLPKDEARRIYEDIVRRKRDPALLEYMGQGLFRTSVFPIPPGSDRQVTVRYTQLCKRQSEVVEFAYPLATQKFTAKPINRLSLRLSIDSKDPLKSIYSPSHEPKIERFGEHEAKVSLTMHDVVPGNDFRLVYTLAEGPFGASVLSYRPSAADDGYFLLLASPDVKATKAKPSAKTVVFVLDRSGSMSGKKIDQAKGALRFVLDNLRDDDTFNIVVYDDHVESFKPELQRYSSEMRSQASRFIDSIHPGGGTDINSALSTALKMLQDDDRPQYVMFLTDGLPTVGEVREQVIAENARKANSSHARLFAFGVGYDVNARLIDRLTGGNGGTSEYVKPDEDIEARVSRFYGQFTSPALAGITIEMPGAEINRTYQRDIPDLFAGGQIVWVGRYHQPGDAEVRISGKVSGERRTFVYHAHLDSADRGTAHDYVEKLWAVRRVGYLIDQIDLHGENKELTQELVALSTKYGILTPYTSFLADENVRLNAMSSNVERARSELRQLESLSGSSGVGQRGTKGSYLNAQNAAAPTQNQGQMMRGMGGPGAGAGGYGYGAGRFYAPNNVIMKDAEGRDRVATTVRQQGRKTFYRRGDRWVDADVKPEDEQKPIVIQQFSDAYFNLARNQTADLNQYLTFDEPVLLNLDGKTYLIERDKRGN